MDMHLQKRSPDLDLMSQPTICSTSQFPWYLYSILIVLEALAIPLTNAPSSTAVDTAIPLASTSNGRLSRKPWKSRKTATVFVSFIVHLPHFPDGLLWDNSRSNLPEGVKTKTWDQRMQKTKKEQAIKKLQAELRDEKQAEIVRFVPTSFDTFLSLTTNRRREAMMQRKKAAEERQRLEENKAKVRLKFLRWIRLLNH
jgi:rRNA-processing protein CGR1